MTAGSEVSETTKSSGASTPNRSARTRTCAADSSAHTSRHRAPRAAIWPSACINNVLLPMPGSPPISVTEPGTRPPPRTRSSSASSVGRGAAPEMTTSPIGTGTGTARRALPAPDAARPAETRAGGRVDSETDPHVPHSVQRPSHFGDWAPQVAHSKTLVRTDVRVMPGP